MNKIGLDPKKCEKTATLLYELLANYSVFYQNVRGYHWNVMGDRFFEQHAKFEELYDDLFGKIDAIAERIRMLDFFPTHRFSNYLKVSTIKESELVSDGFKAVGEILESLKVILGKQRAICKVSMEAEDEGTNNLMITYIEEQEKLVWMYSMYGNKK